MALPEDGKCELCSRPGATRLEFVIVRQSTFRSETASTSTASTSYAEHDVDHATVCDTCIQGECRRQARTNTRLAQVSLAVGLATAALLAAAPRSLPFVGVKWFFPAVVLLAVSAVLLVVALGTRSESRSPEIAASTLGQKIVADRWKDRFTASYVRTGSLEMGLVVYTRSQWEELRGMPVTRG